MILLDTLFDVEDVIAKSVLKLVRAMVVPMNAESYPNLEVAQLSAIGSSHGRSFLFGGRVVLKSVSGTHSREPKARMDASRYRRQL